MWGWIQRTEWNMDKLKKAEEPHNHQRQPRKGTERILLLLQNLQRSLALLVA
jgi:hypothetical protein